GARADRPGGTDGRSERKGRAIRADSEGSARAGASYRVGARGGAAAFLQRHDAAGDGRSAERAAGNNQEQVARGTDEVERDAGKRLRIERACFVLFSALQGVDMSHTTID